MNKDRKPQQNPHPESKSADELLARACSRLLNGGAMLNHMRCLHQQKRNLEYWQSAVALGHLLTEGGDAITRAHEILLAEQGIPIKMPTELVN